MDALINGQRFLDAFANVYFDKLSDDKKNLMEAYIRLEIEMTIVGM